MATQLDSLEEELSVVRKIINKATEHGDYEKAEEYNQMERKLLLQIISLQR